MTVAGLPGIPGGAQMVPALDMFIADALREPELEVCGAFIYRHIEPFLDDGKVSWIKEIEWVRLNNVAQEPSQAFVLDSGELGFILQNEIESLREIADNSGLAFPVEIFMSGFSPLVSIVHSHPGGTTSPSHADFKMLEGASTWRRATAPQSIMGAPDDAQFYEADFIFALHKDEGPKQGTLVHFKRGVKRAEWKGDFS